MSKSTELPRGVAPPRPFSAVPNAPQPQKNSKAYLKNSFKMLMSDPDLGEKISAKLTGVSALTDENGGVNHAAMGRHMVTKFNVCKIDGRLHIYQGGVYKDDVDIIHGHMISLVETIPHTKRREVYKYMEASLETPVKTVSPPHLIPFKSKVFDLNTGQFSAYTPEHVFLCRLPYDYNPAAPEQPLVADTISQIADGDSAVIQLIYEAIGNCFYFRNAYRGAVMLYGESGNNGKSTLLNMIRQLLGKGNTSSLSLHDLTERFRLVGVYGKVANIGDDISGRYLPDAENFKKLVTGEYVTAEYKGQDAFDFVSFAKMFFAMNTRPPVSDKSKAFFSRLLVIPLTHDFSKHPDTGLKDREWTQAEMEYLTRLAMDGLQMLQLQGGFTKPQKVLDLTAQYAKDNDPVSEFLEEHGGVEGEPVADVYTSFQLWCQQAGHKNVCTRNRFTSQVQNHTGLIAKPSRHTRHPGKTMRCFVKA